jgi:hypothetical protein
VLDGEVVDEYDVSGAPVPEAKLILQALIAVLRIPKGDSLYGTSYWVLTV